MELRIYYYENLLSLKIRPSYEILYYKNLELYGISGWPMLIREVDLWYNRGVQKWMYKLPMKLVTVAIVQMLYSLFQEKKRGRLPIAYATTEGLVWFDNIILMVWAVY